MIRFSVPKWQKSPMEFDEGFLHVAFEDVQLISVAFVLFERSRVLDT